MKVVLVLVSYLVLTVAIALAAPIFRGREAPIAIWALSTLVLLAAVVSFTQPSLSTANRAFKVIGRGLIAAIVTAVAAFVGFISMVNVWEASGRRTLTWRFSYH